MCTRRARLPRSDDGQGLDRSRDRLITRTEAARRYLAEGHIQAARRECVDLVADPAERGRGLALLGAIALRDGQEALAARFYERALRSTTDSPTARVELGDLYGGEEIREGLADDARRVLHEHPDDALANLVLARFLERTNHVEEAREHLTQVLARETSRFDARVLAVRIERRLGEAVRARLLGEALLREAPPSEDARRLHFELGRACEDLREHERAFGHFEESNRLHARLYGHPEPSSSGIFRYVERWRECLTTRWIDGWTALDLDNSVRDPVFLLGFPRSGTTLLHQMLASHPHLQVMEERPCMRVLERRIGGDSDRFPAALAALDSEHASALREAYWACVASHVDRRPDAVFVDKLPMHLVRAGTIHRLFPSARFVFVVRHPADVCFSAWSQVFSDGDLVRQFTELDATMELYDRSMRLWYEFRRLLPLEVHVVRYEELVRSPESPLRELCRFLGVGWSAESKNFARGPVRHRYIRTPSYAQASQPLYQRSVQRWRNYEEKMGPGLSRLDLHRRTLGYEAVPGSGSGPR